MMQILLAATHTSLRAAVEPLRAAGLEVVVVDEAEEIVRRIPLEHLAVAVVAGSDVESGIFDRLPSRVRRRVVVVEVADHVRTGDSAAAFVAGVNLLVSTHDIGRLPNLVQAIIARHRQLVSLLEPELGTP
jgi:hypothetical protein